jgi:hypothetical protein
VSALSCACSRLYFCLLDFDHEWAGWTPLGYALRKKNFEMIKMLVQHVDVDSVQLNAGNAEGCDGDVHSKGVLSYLDYAKAIHCEPSILRLLTVSADRRRCCRAAVLLLLGLRRRKQRTLLHGQPTDIILLVARDVWALRRSPDWDVALDALQREQVEVQKPCLKQDRQEIATSKCQMQ